MPVCVAHRERQIAGRLEKNVNVVHLKNLIQVVHLDDILDQDHQERVIIRYLQVVFDSVPLPAFIEYALANGSELSTIKDVLRFRACVDVWDAAALYATIEAAVD